MEVISSNSFLKLKDEFSHDTAVLFDSVGVYGADLLLALNKSNRIVFVESKKRNLLQLNLRIYELSNFNFITAHGNFDVAVTVRSMFINRSQTASIFVFSESIGIPESQIGDVPGLIFVQGK